MVSTSKLRSFVINATSAVSIAAAVPATPIATPTSAAVNAGASLIPSPTIATVPRPKSFKAILDDLFSNASIASPMIRSLSCGLSEARTCVGLTPTRARKYSADPGLSPVIISTSAPIFLKSSTAFAAVGRTTSSHRMMPARRPSTPTHTTVPPSLSHVFAMFVSSTSFASHAFSNASSPLPTSTRLPSTIAFAPCPSIVSKSSTTHCSEATRTAAPAPRKTACASGCDERDSRAQSHRRRAPTPSAGRWFSSPFLAGRTKRTAVSVKEPRVSVPVLSMNTRSMRPSLSRCAEPLTKTPRCAHTVSALTATTGVLNTSAHGHAMTSKTHAKYAGSFPLTPELYCTIMTSAAAMMTTGV